MDAFEVRVTPQRVKNTRMITQNREPVRLMMAPFSSKSVITFEDIPVTKTARRFLIIENPTEEPLQVTLSCKHTQKALRNVQFEWLENTIPELGETTVEITWTPSEAIACKETFFATDHRGFKKELHIIFKSTGGKGVAQRKPLRARNGSALLTVNSGAYSKRLKTPSPPSKKRVTGQRLSPLHDNPYKAQKNFEMPRKTTPKRMERMSEDKENQENSFPSYNPPVQRRQQHHQPMEASPNASDIFNNIQFTPAADKTRANDYMASLPTPKLGEDLHHHQQIHCNNFSSGSKDHQLNYQQYMSAKKIVWSPIFEEIREEVRTPAIVITEDVIQTKTVVKEYFNVDVPLNPEDARRSLFDDEVEAPLNNLVNSSTETYIKDLTINDINRTRILTPPLTATAIPIPTIDPVPNDHHHSHIFTAPSILPHRETIAKDVETIVTTPLSKKGSSMRNLSSKKSREQEYLKLNQGSMPNLHEIETINNIESNRYYSQIAAAATAAQMNPPPVPRLPSSASVGGVSSIATTPAPAYDTGFLLFKENGIRAQSSCSNLHELADNTGLIKTSSERMLRTNNKMGFSLTPAATRVKHPFMTLSPPKSLLQSSKTPSSHLDSSSAKWSQAVRLAAKAKREKDQMSQSSRSLHNGTDANELLKMACQVPLKLEKRRVFYDADMHVQAAINPDPFAATTTHDPFLSATMYLDERATDKYEKQFKNWLNALVTVPIDMDSDQGAHSLDVGKIFNEVRHNKKETVAQTKESVSCKYFTRYRMPLLRRAAVELYMSPELSVPLSKLDVLIEKKQIGMREDRNLHLDLVLQRGILELLLCFNTLWLRIGLEVVFGEELPLSSNADIYGLTSFVLNRMFRDKYLENKYSRNFALTAKYAEQIKKFALRKLLHLIVFLDAAKERRVIKHNPCLFTRASPFKETREILIKVASHLIANIGDISKYMKRLGIVLVHKQTYLDEFDYAFTNLAVDLRDGIRLTKVMEIILLRDDLTKQLRYPAVSRLQKIHNVDLGLKALQRAEYQIHGEIMPKDIVDGHREKTLSLLWQLIYKFRAPKFNAAASTVQRWWRVQMLQREIQHRIIDRQERRMRSAAVTIQRYFRGYRCRQWTIPEYFRERTIATVVIQTYVRAFVARKKFLEKRMATVTIQQWWRRYKDMHRERRDFVKLREAAVTLQQRWRANRLMKEERRRFEELKQTTMFIQQRFRANLECKRERIRFAELKRVTVTVQQRWRANRLMKEERKRFLEMRQATVVIQRRFRDYQLMKRIHMDFVRVQYNVTVIQRYYRGYKAMQKERGDFEKLKQMTIFVQRRFRANVAMRKARTEFMTLKRTAVFVQQRYQAKMLAKEARMNFLRLKWATVTIQRQFRAQLAMRKDREEYLAVRERIVKIQRFFRGYLETKSAMLRYQEIKWAVGVIQVRFRAHRKMMRQRLAYEETRAAIVKIQRWVRANRARDVCRENYLSDRRRIVQVQQRWRAKLLAREVRSRVDEMRSAAIVIQRRFRATREMKRERNNFQALRRAAICLQQKWRARQIGIRVKKEFAASRELIVAVQRHWRGKMQMRRAREEFLKMRGAAVVLQQQWRARMAMRVAVAEFQQLRRFTVVVQTQWRAILEMRVQRTEFLRKRQSSIEIQRHVRGFLVRREMERQRKAAETIQMYYRLNVERKKCQEEYQRLRQAVIVVQREWRRRRVMREDMAEYHRKRQLIIAVQRQFRAQQAMRKEREEFLVIKRAVVVLQQRVKAMLMGRQVRVETEQKRRVIVRIQSLCRGVLARNAYRKLWYEKMSPEAIELRKRNVAALTIQAMWRGYRVRRKGQSKALKEVVQKIMLSRKAKERVTVKLFLGASMHRLKLGLNVSDATKIFRSLEFYSRVVPHVLVTNCVQVARYCYTMLSQATRSEPHKYLIELCCRVALNLARYESTKRQIFLYEYLETIGQMLLRWSDKECPIFNTLCTLIFVFIQTPSHKRIIHNYMTMRDGVFILKETKKAVIRKERMLTNKQRLGVYRTQSQETDLERLPTLECDFGIEMATHLYVFKSRVVAFNTILNELGIELH